MSNLVFIHIATLVLIKSTTVFTLIALLKRTSFLVSQMDYVVTKKLTSQSCFFKFSYLLSIHQSAKFLKFGGQTQVTCHQFIIRDQTFQQKRQCINRWLGVSTFTKQRGHKVSWVPWMIFLLCKIDRVATMFWIAIHEKISVFGGVKFFHKEPKKGSAPTSWHSH